MNKQLLVTNIQRFSLHDGPGLRTTVFFKGCSLRCPWCSNPENLINYPQKYIKDGFKGIYGRYFSSEKLVNECLKDKNFYEGKLKNPQSWRIEQGTDIEFLPGGVTFSGGECLLQMDMLVPVCERLHSTNTHIAVETSLFVSKQKLELALKHIDFFYVDIKILDYVLCKEIEKGNLDIYLTNLDRLMITSIPVVVRVPVIGGMTDDENNRIKVKKLIEKYKNRILKVELIKEHNLGESKYQSLNMNMRYKGVDYSFMEKYKAELAQIGLPVEICSI